jgi:hypothetical protein
LLIGICVNETGNYVMKRILAILLFGALALLSHQALANPCPPGNPPTNCGVPSGTPILDLAGTAIPHSYAQYTADFTATNLSTNLSFAFRDDPAFEFLDDITVTDLTTSTSVSVTNGGFESGVVGGAPVGWAFLNLFGAADSGVVLNEDARTGSNAYIDGSVQAYDGITQAIGTTVGDTYQVSFFLFENSDQSTFQQISTNGDTTDAGGNGIDVLVYAGAIPTAVPEPGSLALVGIALAGIGLIRRKTS